MFILSYDISQRALLFQNKPKPFFDVLFDIVYDPYYAVFQQFDDIQNQFLNCTNDTAIHITGNGTSSYGEGRNYPRCSWLARLLFAVYAAFTCLLLVNLLIAIFNISFQDVQAEAEKTWSFNRVDIITEYIDKAVSTSSNYHHLPLLCNL